MQGSHRSIVEVMSQDCRNGVILRMIFVVVIENCQTEAASLTVRGRSPGTVGLSNPATDLWVCHSKPSRLRPDIYSFASGAAVIHASSGQPDRATSWQRQWLTVLFLSWRHSAACCWLSVWLKPPKRPPLATCQTVYRQGQRAPIS